MNKILYVSNLCSEEVLDYIFETSIFKPQPAAQKFHRILAQGLALNLEEGAISTLSTIPVTPHNHKRKLWNIPKNSRHGVQYEYIPMVNIPYLKNVGVFIFTFVKIFSWSLRNYNKDKAVLSDILNTTVASASLLACKLTGCKNVAIVTDLPGLMITTDANYSLQGVFHAKLASYILSRFSGYVLLTQQMNSVINTKHKPYMIMEGLVDITMKNSGNILENKSKEKILIYAGGLFEKYGIKTLVEAFTLLSDENLRLHLYGYGDMVEDLKVYHQQDPRIEYKGMVPNQVVVKEQLKAFLLLNPRPSDEEFTQFSFPSKIMEYMVSGTPVATTRLPGMPDEYLKYVYVLREESVEGIFKTLEQVVAKAPQELHQKGKEARQFVLQNKNNERQAGRILNFLCQKF